MATDQEIRDAGLLYIPKQKYLQNPYKLPIAPVPPPTEPVPGGITNTNAFTNSGGEEIRYDNSFLPDLPTFNYVDTIRKYGADSKQAQQMLTKAGGTYPGGFQSNEGGFEYTNSFPNNSIQMENLNNSYLNQGNTFQGERFNTNIQDEKQMIAEMAAEGIAPGDPYTYNNNRFSTIKGQNNVFDVNVQGDPALNPGSKMAQGDDPYSEKAFNEEEDKKGFLSKMISRAKQMGSSLPNWARAAATALGGPFAAAASFLGSGKNYEKFDPRGNIKGGVYTIDGVNYTNLDNVNDFYDDDRSSPTYGTTRFDRAAPGSFASFRTLSDYFNRDKDNDNNNTNTTTTNNNTNAGQGGEQGGEGGNGGSSQDNAGGGAAANRGDEGSGWDSSPFARGGRAGYFFGGKVSFKNGGLASIL